jgi:hypothetical protein
MKYKATITYNLMDWFPVRHLAGFAMEVAGQPNKEDGKIFFLRETAGKV